MDTADTHEAPNGKPRSTADRRASDRPPQDGRARLRRPRDAVLPAESDRSRQGTRAPSTAPVLLGTVVAEYLEQLRETVRLAIADGLAEHLKGQRSPHLLDRRGLAEALGVCPDTVDKLRKEGLPTTWVVDSPRFELDRVLTWLRERPAP